MKDLAKQISEELSISIGTGATYSNGLDSYPYYVSEFLPNMVIGLYEAHWKFDDQHPWEGGDGVVDAFDSTAKSELYIKKRYGEWWRCDKVGNPINKFTDKCCHLNFNGAFAYQNPSF